MTKGFTKKVIEQILASKMDEWLNTISATVLFQSTETTPKPTLRQIIKDHYIITGGAIVSLLLGEEPNDYDVYLDDMHVCYELINHYCKIMDKGEKSFDFKENYIVPNPNRQKWVRESIPGSIEILKNQSAELPLIVQEPPKPKKYHVAYFYGNKLAKKKSDGSYAPIQVTSNSLTLSDDIQIVTRVIGNPMEIHQTFDFIHCVSYYTPQTGLVLNRFALESILTKELKYMGSPYPICTLFRMKKFLERGWTISQAEMVKIATDIMKQPLTKENINFQLQNGLNSYWNNFIDSLPNDMALTDLSRKELFDIIDGV